MCPHPPGTEEVIHSVQMTPELGTQPTACGDLCYNPRAWETEAGGAQVQGQPGYAATQRNAIKNNNKKLLGNTSKN